MIRVFYDGKCSLCSKEINYYQKISPNGIFNWQDINLKSNEFINMGIKTSDVLKMLNLVNTNNKLYVGVDAFIVIWDNLNYWKILEILVSCPVIKQIVNLIYKIFANWRFNRLNHCIIAKENDDKF